MIHSDPPILSLPPPQLLADQLRQDGALQGIQAQSTRVAPGAPHQAWRSGGNPGTFENLGICGDLWGFNMIYRDLWGFNMI